MKLIPNRPQLVADAISGFGTVANDLVGKGLPFYNGSLPQRTQDIEQAKSLLKAAGHANLHILLKTSSDHPGLRRVRDAVRRSRPRRPASRSHSSRSRRTPTSIRRCSI